MDHYLAERLKQGNSVCGHDVIADRICPNITCSRSSTSPYQIFPVEVPSRGHYDSAVSPLQALEPANTCTSQSDASPKVPMCLSMYLFLNCAPVLLSVNMRKDFFLFIPSFSQKINQYYSIPSLFLSE